jgi:hypothetical protein
MAKICHLIQGWCKKFCMFIFYACVLPLEVTVGHLNVILLLTKLSLGVGQEVEVSILSQYEQEKTS